MGLKTTLGPRGRGMLGSSLVRPPRWYRQMQGTTLGDDTLDAMSDETFKKTVVANQRELIAAQKHWADGDKMQKWIAIGATLAIPLSAAIWRALGVGRRRRP